MPAFPPSPRLRPALLLILTVSGVLLALPAASVAQAHRSSCHATSTTRSKHATGKCSRPAHRAKPAHPKRHHPAHARPKHRSHTPSAPGAQAAEAPSAAVCDDGSAPFASEEGSFSCEDGSAPECEPGLVEVLSSDGSTLLCEAPAGEEPES
jgi:hypothetical protein